MRERLLCAVAACVLAPSAALSAPVVRSADIHITVTSPTSCEVTMALTVEGASEIDHRIEAHADGIEFVDVHGAQRVGALRTIGSTQSLVLRPDHVAYEFGYRVRRSSDLAYRCPIWLPAVPTDGRSHAVRLHVDLPTDTIPGSSMPDFAWTAVHGSTTLGNIPAFVHVPYGSEGDARPWGIGQVMDAVAVTVFACGTLIWVWRKRR